MLDDVNVENDLGELEPYRPELVFGLVTPVGTPVGEVRESLDRTLRAYGYEPETVRLSDLLSGRAEEFGIEPSDDLEDSRIHYLMDVGDALCSRAQSSAAVLWDAIAAIGVARGATTMDGPKQPRAWILDSLKRPEEVTQLRYIYGDHAVILAAQASDETRRRTLASKIAPRKPASEDHQTRSLIEGLVARDKDDPAAQFGQNVLKTFPLADVFIDCDESPAQQVERFVDLLFKSPHAETPSVEEYGMSLASVAATQSPELGLKVGSAILRDRSVVSLGTNAHPVTSDRSPEFDRSKLDIARLTLDAVRRLKEGGYLDDSAASELEADEDRFTSDLLRGALKGSQIAGLTEFQLPVHAEMSALLDALAQSQAVSGSRIYVTAYPCHNCAKHLLRCGLSGVYLEPYPKSRAEAMYGHDAQSAFKPFTGVAPRMYMRLFGATFDRMDAVGARLSWDAEQRKMAEPAVEFADEVSISVREDIAVSRSVSATDSECQNPSVNLDDTDSGTVGDAPKGE